MKMRKTRTFQSRLHEELKDPEFKAHYQEERQALKLAIKIAKLREKKGLSATANGETHGNQPTNNIADRERLI